jgi:replicative DNA helicase
LFGGLRHTGKTAWARCCAINQGKAGYKVVCFFAESSDADEGVNSMAVLTGFPTKSFCGKKKETLTKLLCEKMIDASRNVPDVSIDTTASLSVEMIENRCRYIKQTKGLDVIFIDYLQLLQGDMARGQNREQYVSEQARRIKVLARELDCAIFMLVQLNDEVAPEDVPEIRHLRESKGPANHADCVMLLQAPNGIGHKSNQGAEERQLRHIWNRKWRGVGASDEAWAIDFHGQTQRFHNEYATVRSNPKEESTQPKKQYGRY